MATRQSKNIDLAVPLYGNMTELFAERPGPLQRPGASGESQESREAADVAVGSMMLGWHFLIGQTAGGELGHRTGEVGRSAGEDVTGLGGQR